MLKKLEKFEKYTKAQFWKCALQVNPYSYNSKYRNKDHGLSEDEWIGVFSADNQNGQIESSHQGAIDLPKIKELATNILEGGREAFLQRKEKYGIV